VKSFSDALFVGLSIGHGALLVSAPSLALVGIGFWWNANTISHNFIHRPFFRRRILNRIYSAYLSLLLGVPQSVWRDRHLSHHAGTARSVRLHSDVVVETILVMALWLTMAVTVPKFFLFVYLPGVALGLALCQVHGYFEHAGGTTSYYGRIYNVLFFNDGYHVEHHRRPGAHWTQLCASAESTARRSRWPPVLRWIDSIPVNLVKCFRHEASERERASRRSGAGLQGAPASDAVGVPAGAKPLGLIALERLVLRSPRLQRFVLGAHERAFRRVLRDLPPIHDVLIVGGGLFPRTALVLRRLLPDASITIVDANASHLAVAQPWIDRSVALTNARFDPAAPVRADLVVIPLSFDGDRRTVYDRPPARMVAVHDWIWSRPNTPAGTVISWLLLKRLNLIVSVRETTRASDAAPICVECSESIRRAS
jgi:fatty acid desaturase